MPDIDCCEPLSQACTNLADADRGITQARELFGIHYVDHTPAMLLEQVLEGTDDPMNDVLAVLNTVDLAIATTSRDNCSFIVPGHGEATPTGQAAVAFEAHIRTKYSEAGPDDEVSDSSSSDSECAAIYDGIEAGMVEMASAEALLGFD